MSLLYHAEIFMLYQKNDRSCKILRDSKIIKGKWQKMKFKYEEQTLHDLTQIHPLVNQNQMPPNKEAVKNTPAL